jgi:uncharacterized MnhB-related membrane protein
VNFYGLVALAMILITVGLGVMQYQIGKKQKTRSIGLIAPIVYFAIRVLITLFTSNDTTAIATAIVGALIISVIYYLIYSVTKKHRTNLDSSK